MSILFINPPESFWFFLRSSQADYSVSLSTDIKFMKINTDWLFWNCCFCLLWLLLEMCNSNIKIGSGTAWTASWPHNVKAIIWMTPRGCLSVAKMDGYQYSDVGRNESQDSSLWSICHFISVVFLWSTRLVLSGLQKMGGAATWREQDDMKPFSR